MTSNMLGSYSLASCSDEVAKTLVPYPLQTHFLVASFVFLSKHFHMGSSFLIKYRQILGGKAGGFG